ncbi:MAG: 16S rRNA (cytosine(967)-C(5))-methyltransferase RsmB [Faecousia sp.]
MGARETALNALIACRKNGAWPNAALKEYLQRDRLEGRDAALATRLVYGVLQNRSKLDFYLKQFLTGKLSGLHPVVKDILHLGLYQISELDRVPDSAAVNEAVELAKKYCPKQKNAPALVNAVLRRAASTRGSWTEPVSYADRYSHPEELISLLKRSLPKGKLEPMLIADNTAPQTAVQVNLLKTTTEKLAQLLEAQGIGWEKHPWMKDCLVLSGLGNLERLDAFRAGLFYVQDPASKLSVQCAQLQKGWRVLDCCAAPGGKSFAAAIAMEGTGSIISCDIHPHKAELISKGAQRLGLENITAQCRDAAQENPQWLGQFDAVIADVPCSGLGIIRKKPDIRYKNLTELEGLPALQSAILENQAKYVRPGGVLLYSTCTVLPRENEDVVSAFLERHRSFTAEPLALPEVFPGNESGMITLIPGEYDTDGFFICRLRRKQ